MPSYSAAYHFDKDYKETELIEAATIDEAIAQVRESMSGTQFGFPTAYGFVIVNTSQVRACHITEYYPGAGGVPARRTGGINVPM